MVPDSVNICARVCVLRARPNRHLKVCVAPFLVRALSVEFAIPFANVNQQHSISSYVPILDKTTGERGAGRGRFSPAGGDVITITGSAFGPSGLDSRFSVKVRPVPCIPAGLRQLTMNDESTGWRQILLSLRRWILSASRSALWRLP